MYEDPIRNPVRPNGAPSVLHRRGSAAGSLEVRLEALRDRQLELARRIGAELARPEPDDTALQRLKRLRLLNQNRMTEVEYKLRNLNALPSAGAA